MRSEDYPYISWAFTKAFPTGGFGEPEPRHLERFWVVGEVRSDITEYYRKQLGLIYPDIIKPEHLPHITIIGGEDVRDHWYGRIDFQAFLKRLVKGCVTFSYSPRLMTNGRHYWLPVVCPEAVSIRRLMGLSDKPEYDFHLTVGYRKVKAGNLAYEIKHPSVPYEVSEGTFKWMGKGA